NSQKGSFVKDDNVPTKKSRSSLNDALFPSGDHVRVSNMAGISSKVIQDSTTSFGELPTVVTMNLSSTQEDTNIGAVGGLKILAKYGLKRTMLNAKGFFFFKFDSRVGLESVLEGGPWMIQNNLIILKKWTMNTSLLKEELNRVPIWVKFHDVPLEDSWGRCSFARCLIEVNSNEPLKDSFTIGILMLEGPGFTKEVINVEYEWKPPRCDKSPNASSNGGGTRGEESSKDGSYKQSNASSSVTRQNILNDSVASWNIKGLNCAPKQKEVRHVVNENNFSICAILESHVDVAVVYDTCKKVMLVQINIRADNKALFCSFIYADNYYVDQRALWNNLYAHASLMHDKPWVLLGYFNVALNLEDHSYGSYEPNIAMREFKEYVQKMEVMDVNAIKASLDKERFLRQKSKIKWLNAGDSNTAYFHKIVKSKIEGTFTPLHDHGLFSRVLSDHKAEFMVREVSESYIKDDLFSMGDDKASGLDGFTTTFFKKSWDIIGGEITIAIRDFFTNGYLGDLVSINQSAFIPGHRISDNTLLTQELMRNYHRMRGPPRCAFKVDIQKAYDTVDWGFLRSILLGFGFHPTMVNWIMGPGFTKEVINVEYEWKPPRCDKSPNASSNGGGTRGEESSKDGSYKQSNASSSVTRQNILNDSVASWNIKGLNCAPKQKEVRHVVNENNFSICAILESHVDVAVVYDTCKKVMLVQINIRADNKALFCSFIYADNYYVDQRALWNNLYAHALLMHDKPWVLLGYFNVALNLEDHSYGSYEPNIAMREFKEYVQKMEVMDVNAIKASLDKERFLRQKSKIKWLNAGDSNTAYFHKIVKSKIEGTFTPLHDHGLFSRVLSDHKAEFMVREVSESYIKDDLFSMGDDKASGLDGFTTTFFKKSWDIIGGEITIAIRDFFTNGYLGDLVSINQSAFIPGHRISDNTLLTQELMRNYHRMRGPPRCAFKVDIQKAYDTVDWGFLRSILLGFGFHPTMVNWIMRRVQNAEDFPYHHLYEQQHIVNLYFADDLFLFTRGHPNSVQVIMDVLKELKNVSRLVSSIPKSTAFFCNVPNALKANILSFMPFAEGEMKKGKAKVAWEAVCLPDHKGGLGIFQHFSIARASDSLRLRDDVVDCLVMLDSKHSTITYTSISSDDGSLDVGSPRVIVLGYDGFPMMPEDPYAYVKAAMQEPPPPNFVPEPSDLEEDLKEEDDEDPEEDPADYPTDRDDEEDEESSRDDADDKEEEKGEDDEEEEEEHLALANSVGRLLAIPTPPPSSLTSYSSPLPHIPSPPLPTSPTDAGAPLGYKAAMIRLRAESPSTSHPLPLQPPIVLPHTKASMAMMRVVRECSSAPTARPTRGFRADYGFVGTLDAEIRCDPDRKIGYGITDVWEDRDEIAEEIPATDVAELGQRMIDLVTTVRQDTYKIYDRLDDAQDDRLLMSGQLNSLRRDRGSHAHTARLLESKARTFREAWVQSMDASDMTRSETQMVALQSHQRFARDPTHSDVPEEAKSIIFSYDLKKMALTRRTIRISPAMTSTTTPVTNAQLKALIVQDVADALAARNADRSRNGDDSHNSGTSSRRT
nr:hypothetical protein [Tanacetum cinerariifolium]